MQPYLNLVRQVLDQGERRSNRTGVDTWSLFGTQTKYDLLDGFPLLTTKKVTFSSVVSELLWFLRGSTNIRDGLTQHTSIWNPWADKQGELGPIYGKQWRDWGGLGIDQITQVVETIKTDPYSRRILVSAWNVGALQQMALPPCHLLFQFYVTTDGRLDCQLYQRSADLALGVPFNIASYALLTIMMAQECEYIPGIFTHTIGDAHIYINHIEKMQEQLIRKPFPLPHVHVKDKPVLEICFDDIELIDYQHHPFIKYPVAV